ncbi:MAG: divalent-cation tolerance protein CutA [Proteobacteria bacterium]|nr:divalent-cation tolerance protein CutA [Pseudomonadota bacterium]
MAEVLLALTTLPDRASADMLAAQLIEEHLAACVNILAPCGSVYRWQGMVETASEIPLLIKTTRDRYPALEAAVQAMHPYEVPELIALPVACGLPAYLDWVAASVTMPNLPPSSTA